MKRMKTVMGIMAAGVMTFAGVAVAQSAAAPSSGPGNATSAGLSMRKFQREAFALRDELAAKRADLQDEYAKAQPDQARIDSLRDDIAALRGKIHAAADKYGVGARGRGYGYGYGPGMMYGWGGPMHRNAGYGRGPGAGCGGWWN